MLSFHAAATSLILATIAFSALTAALSPLSNDLQVRNAPGTSSEDTLRVLRKRLSRFASKRATDTVLKNSTTLDTSWDGAVLFSVSDQVSAESGNSGATLSTAVEIVCTTCYIKGLATAQITINGNFNFSQAFDNITSEIAGEIGNFSTAVVDYVEKYIDNTTTNILSDGFDVDDFDFPPIDVNFDIDIPDIPECQLSFEFDGLELYMEVDTVLSVGATYTLNIYTSKSPIGFGVGDDLFVGVVFTVDLIISVDSQIDVSSGFHILLNDGIAIQIPIFSQNVSSITFNGGSFEFLPVTVMSAGVVINAILRLGIKAGLELGTPAGLDDIAALEFTDVSTGVEVGVWVDVAQFKTNVTIGTNTEETPCEIHVVQEYILALGANAGATLAIGHHTWGPEFETNIPIFFTTLAEACATKEFPVNVPTTAPFVQARQDLETTTTVTEVTQTATRCLSAGLLSCPASLQTTSRNKVTTTLTATITSGEDVVFTTENTIVSASTFGSNIRKMEATSGSPVSFVPKPTSTGKNGDAGDNGDEGDDDHGSSILKGKTGGVSNKIIIGVSVGVGVPVLIAIVAGFVHCYRRTRVTSMRAQQSNYYGHQVTQPHGSEPPMSGKKSPNVNVVEYRRNS